MFEREGSRRAVGTAIASLTRDRQRAEARSPQVCVENSRSSTSDSVFRPLDGIGGDWQAARHCLEHDKTERVRAAWKYEDIARRVGAYEHVACHGAEKLCVLVAASERSPGRTVADDDLCARKVEREEGFDVLLDRDAPDIDEDRTRKWQAGIADAMECVDIDATRPDPEIAETVAFEF